MFSDPKPRHEYSRFFGIYVEIFQMWTSRQQNEVLNIVQAKKYPEVPTFWRLFYRPKMAEISNLLSHFNVMCDNTWVKSAEGYNLLGAFESALCRSNHFSIFKVDIFKRKVTIIILIRRRSGDYKWCVSVWQEPKERCHAACKHAQPAQNLKKKHQKLYLFTRTDQYSGQEISLKITWVSTG